MKNYISPELKFKAASLIEKISTDGEIDAGGIIWGSSTATENEPWTEE